MNSIVKNQQNEALSSKATSGLNEKRINFWLMQNISFMESLTVTQPGCWAEGDIAGTD